MMVDGSVCSPDLLHFLGIPVFGVDSQISSIVLFIKIGTQQHFHEFLSRMRPFHPAISHIYLFSI